VSIADRKVEKRKATSGKVSNPFFAQQKSNDKKKKQRRENLFS